MMWILLIVAAFIASPLIIEATRKKMTPKLREKAPGQFAHLSQGTTHYHWNGPEEGPVAVCIHGLTTPSFVWGGLTKGLALLGFRVLVYDLFGRGYSDRTDANQTHGFFLKQLNDLLNDQGVEDDITVIGYSMGGAIATRFASSQPDRVLQLVLLAPAGMASVGTRLMNIATNWPVLGTWLMLQFYPRMLRSGIRAEKGLPTSVPGITKLQEAELNIQGFVPAVLSSLRGTLARTLEADHRKLKEEGVPVLALWGSDDTVIPLVAVDRLADWNSDAQNKVIKGAGHGLTYSHTPEVLRLIEEFTHQSG